MKNVEDSVLVLPPDYGEWLVSLKQRIHGARQRVVMAVNEEQIRLYHAIGSGILERQSSQGWGTKVINRLAADLQEAFPEMKGADDRSTIGLLLCKTKNRLVAEYALAGTNRPMGIAEYELVRALPEPLDRSLPSIEEIEAEFARDLEDES
jgi:DUF1016 N-terminal domain/YhcG PDDEXK nuclease domain